MSAGRKSVRSIQNRVQRRTLLVLEPLVGTTHRFSGMGDFAFGYGKDYGGKEVKEGLQQGQREVEWRLRPKKCSAREPWQTKSREK